MRFTVEQVQKLHRGNIEIYLGIKFLEIIRSWNFSTLDSDGLNSDVIIVCYESLIMSSSTMIEVENPEFVYRLPLGNDWDEYPVLFIENHNYLSKYCEAELMSNAFFNRLIEKEDKLSANSTKLMTIRSLREILKVFHSQKIEQRHWSSMVKELISFLESLTRIYSFLGYLPVSERKIFKKLSIADSSLAWNFYFRYFLEAWLSNDRSVRVPDILKVYHNKNWSGQFFDRMNPIWEPFIDRKGKIQSSDAHRDLIYTIWIEWIKEA